MKYMVVIVFVDFSGSRAISVTKKQKEQGVREGFLKTRRNSSIGIQLLNIF
jgi:hypothetical protein